MNKFIKAINIVWGIVTGSAIVIIKQDDERARVYCGKNVDKAFAVRSMASTLKTMQMPRMAS